MGKNAVHTCFPVGQRLLHAHRELRSGGSGSAWWARARCRRTRWRNSMLGIFDHHFWSWVGGAWVHSYARILKTTKCLSLIHLCAYDTRFINIFQAQSQSQNPMLSPLAVTGCMPTSRQRSYLWNWQLRLLLPPWHVIGSRDRDSQRSFKLMAPECRRKKSCQNKMLGWLSGSSKPEVRPLRRRLSVG